MNDRPIDVDAPHEILGISAAERDPVRIVAAASARLQAIQRGGGSQREVRRTVTALIRLARDAMLREACDGSAPDQPAASASRNLPMARNFS